MSDNWLCDRYIYDGNVFDKFDNVIEVRWHGETIAPSLEKAMSNLRWQFCKETDRFPYSGIKLDKWSIKVKPNKFKYSQRKNNEFDYTEFMRENCEQLKLFD